MSNNASLPKEGMIEVFLAWWVLTGLGAED